MTQNPGGLSGSAPQKSRRPVMRLKALGVSAGLSILFLLIYGSCGWIATQRHDLPTLYFEWERMIPFVPLMIIPYMSQDLFFIAAPFLCRDERELWTFFKRAVVVLAVAGICFLLFPFRYAFERPHAGGWLGAIFDWFQSVDRPTNLIPSLHIAFQMILAQHYARHTRGLLRTVSNIWFVLIGLSTLLTYQHHVIDVVAGFALGVYTLYFIRERREKFPVIANRRIGTYYLIGALALLGLAALFWPWGSLLLWPAAAMAIVASAYFGVGPVVFRKANGELPWSAWMVLFPCLLGQRLSLLYYRRQCRPWDQLTPRVWIGRLLNRGESAEAARLGVTAVLDLSAELSETAPFRALHYRNIPILDLTAPTLDQLQEMAEFIEHESLRGIVYVHCKIGYSRTAAAAAAYLLQTGKATSALEAIELLRQVRPAIVVRPEVVSALSEFSDDIASPMVSSAA